MNDYFLVASPTVNSQKDSGHRIKSVLFVATNGIKSRRYVVQNTGALVLDLACLVDAGRAARIIQKLCGGRPYLFYETFTLEQIEAWMDGRGKVV